MSVFGKTIEASIEKPFLSLQILFTQEQIFEAIEEFSLNLQKQSASNFSASTHKLSEDLEEIVIRIFKLNQRREDINILSKMYLKEILF